MLSQLSHSIRAAAFELKGTPDDYAPLLEQIGDTNFVFLGEATHGTHEFYEQRARISKELIQKKRFNVIAVEADWPDSCRINKYIRGTAHERSAAESLTDFTRFPIWMWRNEETLNLIEWLYNHNKQLREEERVGFYGLDVYSLFSSAKAVTRYLETVDPDLAAAARARYECLEGFQGQAQRYGLAASLGMTEKCERAIIEQILLLQKDRIEYLKKDGFPRIDAQFCAEQNAKIVRNAAFYYEALFTGSVNTWNLRDSHMFDTIEALAKHLTGSRQRETKIIVWAHNSHIGDAQATDMGARGEYNIGALIRAKYPKESKLIGFTTSVGSVIAAQEWDGPFYAQKMRPPLTESYEHIFSKTDLPNFVLRLDDPKLRATLSSPRLERAIGVIYRPEIERLSHYFYASLPQQFDAIIHLEETTALKPLATTVEQTAGEAV